MKPSKKGQAPSSVTSEEPRKLYECAARDFCGAENRQTCQHAMPHEWSDVKGCGNHSWCGLLAVKLQRDANERKPETAKLMPETPDQMRAVIAAACMDGKSKQPECVEVK